MTETTPVQTSTPTQAPTIKAKALKKTKPAAAKTDKPEGLRGLQIKVLKVLAKNKSALTRPQLYEKLGFKHQSGLNDVVGKNDPKARAKADKEKYPCLITLGMVKAHLIGGDGEVAKAIVYEITAKGRKAASAA